LARCCRFVRHARVCVQRASKGHDGHSGKECPYWTLQLSISKMNVFTDPITCWNGTETAEDVSDRC
jgi:hypothetical protein